MVAPNPPRTEPAVCHPRAVSEFDASARLLDLEDALDDLAADVADVWFPVASK